MLLSFYCILIYIVFLHIDLGEHQSLISKMLSNV